MQEPLIYTRLATRVVPLELGLKTQRYFLFFGIAIGATYIVTFLFFRPVNKVIFYADPFFALLWLYSFYPLVYIVQGKPWRVLEKKRQEAARYNLSLSLPTQIPFRQDFSDVPARFMIRLRRRWLTTWVLAIVGGLYLALIVLFLYASWQDMMSLMLHQQESLILALLLTALNITIVLVSIVSLVITLFFTSRQYLIATRDGLISRLGFHFSYISWEQARLFAVIGEGETKKHRDIFFYELSSEDAVIRWSSLPKRGGAQGTPSATIGATGWLAQADSSEGKYQQDIQTLISIVAVRTGLPLYDLR